MADSDTLPPEVQAVIDAAHHHWHVSERAAEVCAICDALRAYDASRAPKEIFTATSFGAALGTDPTFPTVILPRDGDSPRQLADRLNGAWRGELFTRAQVEQREQAADRKAREECVEMVKARFQSWDSRVCAGDVVAAIRASIKP